MSLTHACGHLGLDLTWDVDDASAARRALEATPCPECVRAERARLCRMARDYALAHRWPGLRGGEQEWAEELRYDRLTQLLARTEGAVALATERRQHPLAEFRAFLGARHAEALLRNRYAPSWVAQREWTAETQIEAALTDADRAVIATRATELGIATPVRLDTDGGGHGAWFRR